VTHALACESDSVRCERRGPLWVVATHPRWSTPRRRCRPAAAAAHAAARGAQCSLAPDPCVPCAPVARALQTFRAQMTGRRRGKHTGWRRARESARRTPSIHSRTQERRCSICSPSCCTFASLRRSNRQTARGCDSHKRVQDDYVHAPHVNLLPQRLRLFTARVRESTHRLLGVLQLFAGGTSAIASGSERERQ
jgi:hypothetical protein